MNKIFSLILKAKSGWVTPLQADTIFGHLCWKIKQNEGKDQLEKFLKEMEKPFFVISNVFPKGYVPRPRLEEEFQKEEKGNKEEMAKEFDSIKEFKEVIWIKIEDLEKFSNFNDEIRDNIKNKIKDEKIPQSFSEDREIKTTINRFTSTTLEEQGPYSLPYFCLSENKKKKQDSAESEKKKEEENENTLWLLMKVLDENKINEFKVKEYLKLVFTEGYGKRKSIGKGVFEIIKNDKGEDWQKIEIPKNENGKYILSLSNFVPSKNDPADGLYEIFVKYGKLGEERSISGSGNFYKKPLIMLKEGATFKISSPNKEYLGRMLKGISFYNDNEICHYAYGFPLRF